MRKKRVWIPLGIVLGSIVLISVTVALLELATSLYTEAEDKIEVYQARNDAALERAQGERYELSNGINFKFELMCFKGVYYVVGGHHQRGYISPYIDEKTLTYQRCEEG